MLNLTACCINPIWVKTMNTQPEPEDANNLNIINAAKNIVGSIMMYEMETTDDRFNYLYFNPTESYTISNPPRLILKALKSFYTKNNMSYNMMVERMVNVLQYTLKTYPFEVSNEKITIRNKLLHFESGDSSNKGLNRLVRMGISHNQSWYVASNNPADIEKYMHTSQPNIISTIYSYFFNVPDADRKHIIDNLPDINFPSYLLEAYIYLKFLQKPKHHNSDACTASNTIYNRALQKSKTQTYPITHRSIIDEKLDIKARISNIHEPLLLMYLTFHISCIPEPIVWEAIHYDEIINLYQKIVSYKNDEGQNMVGRIVGEDFYQSARKASFMLIFETTSFKNTETKSTFTGEDYKESQKTEKTIQQILTLMSSNIPSSLWKETQSLPASWLELL